MQLEQVRCRYSIGGFTVFHNPLVWRLVGKLRITFSPHLWQHDVIGSPIGIQTLKVAYHIQCYRISLKLATQFAHAHRSSYARPHFVHVSFVNRVRIHYYVHQGSGDSRRENTQKLFSSRNNGLRVLFNIRPRFSRVQRNPDISLMHSFVL